MTTATYFVTPEGDEEPYRVVVEAVADGWTATVERNGRQWTFPLRADLRRGRVWIAGRLRRCAWNDGRLSLDGIEHPLVVESEARHRARRLRKAGRAGHGVREVRAPIPGMIVAVEVEEGARVDAGQGVVVIEAMKMENEVVAPVTGVVRELTGRPGQAVERNALVCRIEPDVHGTAGGDRAAKEAR